VNDRQEVTPVLAMLAALAALAGLVVSNLVTQPLYRAVEQGLGATAALGFGALTSEVGLLVPLVAVIIVARLDPRSALGLRRPRSRPMVAALLAVVGGGVIVDQVMFAVLALLPHWRGGNLDVVGRLIAGAGPLGSLALVVPLAVVPAMVEEALCRGVVLRGLQRWFRTDWVPVLASALFFGALHFDPLHVLGAVLMGLLLGWIAVRTGSIWPPVLCHLVNNAISLLSPALGGPSLPDVLDHGHSWPVLGTALVALGAGLIWLQREAREMMSDE
jgi:membrane protease YdiL (CAAX protease family)